jgi:uncharacterized protein (DUF58 family)
MAITGRTGLLALLGAVVVGALAPSWWGLLGVGAVLAALVGLDLALAGPVRPLRITRSGDTSVRLGEPATTTLTIENPGSRRVRALVRDAWPPSAGARTQRQRVEVPPGERRRVVTDLLPTRRGDRPAHQVTVRSYGPLRLAARQGSHAVPWRVRVLPPFTSRKHLPSRLARLRELDGRTAVLVRGQGTEFDNLREYVVGDDVRSIDWRASARRSDVVVRTWRPERDRRVLCVLDTGRTSAARIGDEPRLDAAMDAALLLASLASRADDRVDLLAIDTAVRASVTNVSKKTLLWRLVSAMAPLDPALVETDFGLVAGEVLRRERKRALVVLFTALEPAALGEGLMPVLPRLAARHKVVVAAVHDPALTQMTTLPAEAPAAADVYAAAAAQRALAERDRVRAALRRFGVEVIDAPVDTFASRVADAYLAMKATGRL